MTIQVQEPTFSLKCRPGPLSGTARQQTLFGHEPAKYIGETRQVLKRPWMMSLIQRAANK